MLRIFILILYFAITFGSCDANIIIRMLCNGTCYYTYDLDGVDGKFVQCYLNENGNKQQLEKIDLNCENRIPRNTIFTNGIVEIYFSDASSRILNQTINLDSARYQFEIINLLYFSGIDIGSNPFGQKKKSTTRISMFHSNFTIFKNAREIVSDADCNTNVFDGDSIFKELESLQFDSMSFSSAICPLIFRNVLFEKIYIRNQESLDQLKFMDLNESNDTHLNATIREIRIYRVQNLTFNSAWLNKYLFKRTLKISIDSSPLSMASTTDCEALGNLKSLRDVAFLSYHFRYFYSKLKSCFLDPKFKRDSELFSFNRTHILRTFTRLEFQKDKQLTDSEFCLFSDFPHHKILLPTITEEEIDCDNCLHLFLNLNNVVFHEFRIKCRVDWDFIQKLYNCQFDSRIAACGDSSSSKPFINFKKYIDEIAEDFYLKSSANNKNQITATYIFFYLLIIIIFLFL